MSEVAALLEFIRNHPLAALVFAWAAKHCTSVDQMERDLHRMAVFCQRLRLIWRKARGEPDPFMRLPE